MTRIENAKEEFAARIRELDKAAARIAVGAPATTSGRQVGDLVNEAYQVCSAWYKLQGGEQRPELAAESLVCPTCGPRPHEEFRYYRKVDISHRLVPSFVPDSWIAVPDGSEEIIVERVFHNCHEGLRKILRPKPVVSVVPF